MRPSCEVALNAVTGSASSPTAIPAQFLLSCSLQVASTGLVGTAKLQFSNDKVQGSTQPTNWTDIPSATVSVTGAGVFGIPKTDLAYEWIQVVYTNSSGTGTLSANLHTYGF